MKITKVFNNSVVLSTDDSGQEVVLFGSGLGFGARPGAEIDPTAIEKRFVPSGTTTVARLASYLEDIPLEDIELAERILALARSQLGAAVAEHGLLPLADHLTFALYRVREGIAIDYPLQADVESLYPREVAFARQVLAFIREHRGVDLPALEAVPLALHFVNAQFGSGEVSETVKVTAALTATLQAASDEFGWRIDPESVAFSRFLTHVRYLVLRRARGVPDEKPDDTLGEAVKAASPVAAALADRLADELDSRFGWHIGDDERLYLTLHAFRLLPRP